MGTKMAANFHCTPVTPGKAFGILSKWASTVNNLRRSTNCSLF